MTSRDTFRGCTFALTSLAQKNNPVAVVVIISPSFLAIISIYAAFFSLLGFLFAA